MIDKWRNIAGKLENLDGSKNLIENVIFIKKGGIAFIIFNENSKYIELVPSYLEALRSFSEELGNLGDLRSIKLSVQSLTFYSSSEEYSIISIHDSRIPLSLLTNFLKEINTLFLQHYTEDDVINWNNYVGFFQKFIPLLAEKVKTDENKFLILIPKEKGPLELITDEIFSNPDILAIVSVDTSGKQIQTTVNTTLNDFEIQVFISSPYLNRSIINLMPMLKSVSNRLLKGEEAHYIVKTEKFYLGMKEKNKMYYGLIGNTKESIKNEIIKI